MSSSLTDPSQLFCLLETCTDTEVDKVKALIHENLNQTKESSYLNSLVDFYLSTGSTRCLEILVGIREPHDRHLFDKLNDGVKGGTRLQMLTLLSHVVYKHPSWLYRISQHSLLASLLKVLKTDAEVPNLVCAVLVLVTLLPVIPSSIGPFLNDIFEIFTRLASLHSKKPANFPDIYLMHLLVGVYALFHRLYGMYPCHFVGYMRGYCSGSSRDHLYIFAETIRPMLDFVRLHPLLITTSKEIEVSTTRWKHMETHDIVVECAKLSLDVVEGTREDLPGQRLICPSFRPIQEVCQLLHSSQQGSVHPSEKALLNVSEDSIVGQASTMDPSLLWSPSVSCGLSTPPKTLRSSPSLSSQASAFQNVGPQMDTWSAGRTRPVGTSSGSVTPIPQYSVPISPLKMENNPFRFTSAGDVLVSKRAEDGGGGSGHQKVLQAPGTPMLIQVVKKLEEHKSSEKEDPVDSEVATIIGQASSSHSDTGSSNRHLREAAQAAARPPAPFQSQVIRGPVQCCFSPFLRRSLQSAQRSRSFSQGKKMARRATIDIADKRIPLLCKSRSLPDLKDLAMAAASVVGDEEAGRCVLTGPSPMQPLRTLDERTMDESDSSNAFAIHGTNYAHLLPSAFPQLLCPSCQLPKATSAAAPLFSQMSPLEILDRYVESCGSLHLKQISTESRSKDSHSKGKAQQEEINILKGQVQLLHIQLLYERHKREIHAERNRRLLGKVKRAKALEEQNAAMKDQMQLQENEIAQLSRNAVKLRDERHSVFEKLEPELQAVRAELKTVLLKKTTLEETCKNLEDELSISKNEIATLQKDIEKIQSELFNTLHELQAIQTQVSLNEAIKKEVRRLNRELLLSVELNKKYQEKLMLLQNDSQFEVKLSSLRQSHTLELNELKLALETKEAYVESLKARVTKLEGLLVKKDKTVAEHKRLLNSVKEEYVEQVKAIEDKYAGRRLVCQHLESEILKLHHKLDITLEDTETDRIRRRGSQSRSSRLGSNPLSLASAKGNLNTGDECVQGFASVAAINASVVSVGEATCPQTVLEVQLPLPHAYDNSSDVIQRRRASEPINIDPGVGPGQGARRQRKEGSRRYPTKCEAEEKIFDDDELLLCPDVFPRQDRISGALTPITSQSLASIVDFAEGIGD